MFTLIWAMFTLIRAMFTLIRAMFTLIRAIFTLIRAIFTRLEDRTSMAQLELGLDLPPGESLTVSVSCIKVTPNNAK